MAFDQFLTLNDIEGEAADETYKGQIDVLSWSWGASQSGSMHVGGGGGSGKAAFQDIAVTKWVDKSSPSLMDCVAQGRHIEEATLVVRKAGGKEKLEYLRIEMKGVLITSLSTGGSAGEDRLTENLTINFREYTLKYQPQDEKGAKKGGEVASGFNIAEGKAS